MIKEILVTGGAGYIGSHTVVELIETGFEPIVVDNLSNSSANVIDRIGQITGKKPIFYKIDVCNQTKLAEIFTKHNFDAVIHFAGLKAVGESVEKPLSYYRNNIDSSLSLFETMLKFDVRKLIFSSSATVYGDGEVPFSEDDPTGVGITNPYGQTKFMIEQIMKDLCIAEPSFQAVALRYFNPIGAHPSGLIGEDPKGIPNNLLPYVLKVAAGELPEVRVFGNDYDTPDGTGVRDYIHVIDLAQGHLAALKHIQSGFTAINLGTGHGTSVLELIKATELASNKTIPYTITKRRAGDLATIYANVDKAKKVLGWQTHRDINEACRDSWKWQNYKTSKK
ncbi:MAG: UDP-glucose 4-epimerase GalE [Candidatus Nanosyncoccaceae bacterium]|jgi:UDP-glucose 4-epimerase